MKASQYSLLLAIATVGYAHPGKKPPSTSGNQSNCQDIMLDIQAQSHNLVYPPYPNSTAPGMMYQYLASYNSSALPTTLVQGTFKISTTFCQPTVKVQGREATIQVLLHGLSATKVR